MQIHSTLDPVALRIVVRSHLSALKRVPPWDEDTKDRLERSVVILKARLFTICGDNDVHTPEVWRKERGLK